VLLIVVIISIAGLFCAERTELGKPAVTGIRQELGEITDSESEILTSVTVQNPNPVSIALVAIEADVLMNGERIGKMSSVGNTELKASQVSVLLLSTKIDNQKIRGWWMSHIKNGERTEVRIPMNLIFDLGLTKHKYPIVFNSSLKTDILSDLDLVQEELAGLPDEPASLTLKSMNSRFGEVTDKETEVITTLVVANRCPVKISGYYYEIVMNEVTVGEGRVAANFARDSATAITFITPIRNDKINEWWVSHLKNGERTELKLNIQPVVEVNGIKYNYTMLEAETEFTTSILSTLSEVFVYRWHVLY